MASPWHTQTCRRFVGGSCALLVGGFAGCSGDGDSAAAGPSNGEAVVDETITEENTWNVELGSEQTMTVDVDTSDGLARVRVLRPEGYDGERLIEDTTSRDPLEFTHTASETSGEFVVNVQPSGSIGIEITVS